MANRTTTDRRAFLLGAGAVLLGACTNEDGDGLDGASTTPTTEGSAASGSLSTPTEVDGSTALGAEVEVTDALTPEMFAALPACALTRPAAEGPFPSQAPIVRREIHEDLPGHPLRLGLRVVDGQCEPMPGAIVDIWHTDASGDYSEYADNGSGKDEGEGSTFCRGAQTADENGIVEFLTIYPGWYEGRTVHIHATVKIDDDVMLTTQLYLDEALTAEIHAAGEYARFGPQDTNWAQDVLTDDPAADGALLFATATETSIGAGTLALINLGVER